MLLHIFLQHNQHLMPSRNVGVCFSVCTCPLMASETQKAIVHSEMSVGMFAQISIGMDLGVMVHLCK